MLAQIQPLLVVLLLIAAVRAQDATPSVSSTVMTFGPGSTATLVQSGSMPTTTPTADDAASVLDCATKLGIDKCLSASTLESPDALKQDRKALAEAWATMCGADCTSKMRAVNNSTILAAQCTGAGMQTMLQLVPYLAPLQDFSCTKDGDKFCVLDLATTAADAGVTLDNLDKSLDKLPKDSICSTCMTKIIDAGNALSTALSNSQGVDPAVQQQLASMPKAAAQSKDQLAALCGSSTGANSKKSANDAPAMKAAPIAAAALAVAALL